jgi:tRNA-splicing ligase RtcB
MPIKGVLGKARVPVKLWTPLDEVESSALDQLTNIANLPFVFKHVAAMPDVHLGKGATVGSVIATKGAVVPAAVGVDIGCGMAAVKTNLTSHDFKDGVLRKLRGEIEDTIPVGFNQRKEVSAQAKSYYRRDEFFSEKPLLQLGTLGGGNHFIEICLDTEDNVWIMLHSGSRNYGKTLAEVHINNAKKIMEQMFIKLEDKDLAYFSEGTEEFDNYVHDVLRAQSYALYNRLIMLEDVVQIMTEMFPNFEFKPDTYVNCHHNYLEREHHFGENVIVTRKGAIRARKGDMGIIPGSMGTRSYIVRGLGNPDSFNSASHGAGRRMSRTKAKEVFTVADLKAQTSGVECRKDSGVLDEIPGAYKDIDQVMANQSDLVEIVAELKQVLCVKG